MMMQRIILALVILAATVAVGVVWVRQSMGPPPTPSAFLTPPTQPQSETLDLSALPPKASCALKGTIRYITPQTYNNGDALFTYVGVDHPGRNVFWNVTPSDGIDVGPDIFTELALPDGSSLLSITLPARPTAKRYTVTASIQYGRLDANNNVKVSVTPCRGATAILLP